MVDICTIISVLVGIAVAWMIIKKGEATKEGYEPRDMGSRKYWGFGRTYGYSIDDHEETENFCYQAQYDELCMEGYTRKFNPITHRVECCVNRMNYGMW